MPTSPGAGPWGLAAELPCPQHAQPLPDNPTHRPCSLPTLAKLARHFPDSCLTLLPEGDRPGSVVEALSGKCRQARVVANHGIPRIAAGSGGGVGCQVPRITVTDGGREGIPPGSIVLRDWNE